MIRPGSEKMSPVLDGQRSPGDIVVVGGYGAVGRIASLTLAKWFPGQVLVAGPRREKAQQLADLTEGAIVPQQLDVQDPVALAHVLRHAGVLVMCADQDNVDVGDRVPWGGVARPRVALRWC